MDIDGTEVKTFSDSIEIIFKVDTALINPDTGLKYAVGDSVELWTNDSSDVWSFERYAAVQQGVNGLEIIYETDHLSGKAPMKTKSICTTDPEMRFVFSNWPSNAIKTMKLNLFRNGTPFGSAQMINFAQAGTNVILTNLFRVTPSLQPFSPTRKMARHTVRIWDLCADPSCWMPPFPRYLHLLPWSLSI